MASSQLLKELEHLNEVRRRMATAGFTEAGRNFVQLTREEVRELERGYRAGVSAADIADVFIARRNEQLAAAVADGYVESDESGDPRVVASAAAGGR